MGYIMVILVVAHGIQLSANRILDMQESMNQVSDQLVDRALKAWFLHNDLDSTTPAKPGYLRVRRILRGFSQSTWRSPRRAVHNPLSTWKPSGPAPHIARSILKSSRLVQSAPRPTPHLPDSPAPEGKSPSGRVHGAPGRKLLTTNVVSPLAVRANGTGDSPRDKIFDVSSPGDEVPIRVSKDEREPCSVSQVFRGSQKCPVETETDEVRETVKRCPGCHAKFFDIQKHIKKCCPEFAERLADSEAVSLKRKELSPDDWIDDQEVREAVRAAVSNMSDALQRRALELRFGFDRGGLRRTPAEVGMELGGKFAKNSETASQFIRNALKSIPLVADDPSQLDVLFEDDEVLAVAKPPGLRCQPPHRFLGKSLTNQIVGHLHSAPHIVHRLDQCTSGVLVVGKTRAAAGKLQAQWHTSTCQKTYVAILQRSRDLNSPSVGDSFDVDAPLGKASHLVHDVKRKVDDAGQSALTRFQILARSSLVLLVSCILLQGGRTHQIRVHASHVGMPVVGDELYGGIGVDKANISRVALHAWRLHFAHPKTGEKILVTASLPKDMRQCCLAHKINCTAWTSL